MVVQYIREQAWWRLDSPGPNPIRVARSVVALLDAAACIAEIPENHPDLEELDRAGCFESGLFNPGDTGLAVVRGWELADQPTGTEQDLLGALAVTVSADRGVPSPRARRAARSQRGHPGRAAAGRLLPAGPSSFRPPAPGPHRAAAHAGRGPGALLRQAALLGHCPLPETPAPRDADVLGHWADAPAGPTRRTVPGAGRPPGPASAGSSAISRCSSIAAPAPGPGEPTV